MSEEASVSNMPMLDAPALRPELRGALLPGFVPSQVMTEAAEWERFMEEKLATMSIHYRARMERILHVLNHHPTMLYMHLATGEPWDLLRFKLLRLLSPGATDDVEEEQLEIDRMLACGLPEERVPPGLL